MYNFPGDFVRPIHFPKSHESCPAPRKKRARKRVNDVPSQEIEYRRVKESDAKADQLGGSEGCTDQANSVFTSADQQEFAAETQNSPNTIIGVNSSEQPNSNLLMSPIADESLEQTATPPGDVSFSQQSNPEDDLLKKTSNTLHTNVDATDNRIEPQKTNVEMFLPVPPNPINKPLQAAADLWSIPAATTVADLDAILSSSLLGPPPLSSLNNLSVQQQAAYAANALFSDLQTSPAV